MARRRQFNAICHDLLETFISRYNDLNGYWALGYYQAHLLDEDYSHLEFNLVGPRTEPSSQPFPVSEAYYRGAVYRLMRANVMPPEWLALARITFKSVTPEHASCVVYLQSDLGRAYQIGQSLKVRRHDPSRESRRGGPFGPSNQKGQ